MGYRNTEWKRGEMVPISSLCGLYVNGECTVGIRNGKICSRTGHSNVQRRGGEGVTGASRAAKEAGSQRMIAILRVGKKGRQGSTILEGVDEGLWRGGPSKGGRGKRGVGGDNREESLFSTVGMESAKKRGI